MGIGSSADNSGISIVEESTWGTTPATPSFERVMSSGDGLQLELSKGRLKGMRPEGVVSDLFTSKGGANGEINLEMFYGSAFSLLFAHVLRGDYDQYGVVKTDVLEKSVTIEKTLLANGSTYYKRYPGMRLDSLAVELNAESEDAIGMTLGFMGQTEETDTAILSGATYADMVSTYPLYMPEIRKLTVSGGGLSGTLIFKNFSFTINNKCREQQGKSTAVSSYPDISAKGIAYGTREITITLEAYFTTFQFRDIFLNNTSFSLSYIISNGSAGYKVTFPKCKIVEDGTPIEGSNSDVLEKMAVEALYDDTTSCVIQIEKIGSLATDGQIKVTGTCTPDIEKLYFKNGDTHDTKDVYEFINGGEYIWWDTTDTCWYVSDTVGTEPTPDGWKNTTAAAPTGSFTPIGSATGTPSGAVYDPEA